MYKNIIFTGLLLIFNLPIFSQSTGHESQNIFQELRANDSLLFNLGFNHCDTTQFRILLSDDFEFYHDQNGLLESKEVFIQNIPNLCKMNYKASRVLVENSLNVFPLYSNGILYGAIQTGTHEFYGEQNNQARYLTSTAKFTHVWVLENNDWKLRRILSYDHVASKK